jgi:hypothetical protein
VGWIDDGDGIEVREMNGGDRKGGLEMGKIVDIDEINVEQ